MTFGKIAERIAWGALALFAVAIGAFSLRYLSFDADIAPEELRPNLDARPFVFYLHTILAAVSLLIGVWQFLPATRRSRYHRLAGRVYVGCVVIASVSGFVIAIHTEAGPIAATGFAILSVLWLASTLFAFAKIRARDRAAHRVWMIRSYALACAAISLRLILPLGIGFGATFNTSYTIAAWASWSVNLVIAEWIIRKGPFGKVRPSRATA